MEIMMVTGVVVVVVVVGVVYRWTEIICCSVM